MIKVYIQSISNAKSNVADLGDYIVNSEILKIAKDTRNKERNKNERSNNT